MESRKEFSSGSQDFLLAHMLAQEFAPNLIGVCLGYSCTGLQDFLAGEEGTFEHRLSVT